MKTFNILEAINTINKTLSINLNLVERIEYTNSLDNMFTFTLYFVNRDYVYIVNLNEGTFYKQIL